MVDRFAQPRKLLLSLAMALAVFGSAYAQVAAGGRFDLTGPRIDVHVQRGDQSLPIAMVPNLQENDRLTVHADLPSSQSVKLILVIAFLRGSTNPPPDSWFTRVNTWDRKVRAEGVSVAVPKEAQQTLIFLAPETGGDFATLKSAVMGRPGVFVRAAQDLNEASFEQARIERYLQAIRSVPPGSPAELLDHSKKLAATLNLKPNEACFKKAADQQLDCLRQTGTQVLLDDGHGQTLASMITNGDSANLIGAVAGTPMANANGAGAYSAYIGTVIDVVRLLSGLHTAQFQYIPAIAFPDQETLNLRLNTPPSFHNPKSVIVVALPAIQKSIAPPLRLQDADHVSCLLEPLMVLPLEGAPLVFATSFAHDLVLHLNGGTFEGRTDLPLVPDAYDGGLVLSDKPGRKPLDAAVPEARDALAPDAKLQPGHGEEVIANKAALEVASPDTGETQITGTLRGFWGFDSFQGVTVPLQRRTGSGWTAVSHADLYAGRANNLELRANGTACASRIELESPGGKQVALTWKQAQVGSESSSGKLELKLPLEGSAPGNVNLLVHQYGTKDVAEVTVKAYSDSTRLQTLHLHAGDNFATLTGAGLQNVRVVKLEGMEYKPATGFSAETKEMKLVSSAPKKDEQGKAILSTAGETGTGVAILQDGRSLPVNYTVDAARPTVEVLSKSIRNDLQQGLPLNLENKDDLPLNARITFALRSGFPARFPRTEKIEIALADGSLHTTLSIADGSLVLQDTHTALAYFSPGKAFGPSAFGPLQLRPVAEDGTVGDWIQLGTLVRMPIITGMACTHAAHGPSSAITDSTDAAASSGCSITGNNLFLIDAIAADSGFASAFDVPLGFAGEVLPVPRPADGHTLYLRLRDDASTAVNLTLTTPLNGAGRHSASTAAPGATNP